MNGEIMTLEDVAKMLKISKRRVQATWHGWKRYGVKTIRLTPTSQPRFLKADAMRMVLSTTRGA